MLMLVSIACTRRTTESRSIRVSPRFAGTNDCRSAAAILYLQRHKAGNRDGEIELPDNRLEIGQAAGERVDRDDVPIPGGGQAREAEIHHRGEVSRGARRRRKAGEASWVHLPDQAEGLGEDRPEVQIQHDCTLKAANVMRPGA